MVYLAGAGAGDFGLITLNGLECIKKADTIIFDRLVNISLLNHAPADCRFIYAGKESGNHHMTQSEINEVIVKCARDGGNVVRLKGGDPFIFGRGGEEAQYLSENGIDFELVPGVSSCYSAAEYAGIPVTHRQAASSFHVITGHETENRVDYSVLAKEEGTLVFMMGLKALSEIADKLIKNGKNPDTPAAVISNGTLRRQKCVTGTLRSISDAAKDLKSPAAIVVGDAVNERVKWFNADGALSGLKIVSTATEAVSDSLRAEVNKRGGELTEVSIIKTEPINFDKFKRLNFAEFTHIVFSSANSVDVFFRYLADAKTDMRKLCNIKFAAVGEKTARSLSRHGIYADFVPEKADGISLAALLEGVLTENDSVLFPCAETASSEVGEAVKKAGAKYAALPIYRTETNYNRAELLALAADGADYIIFASGSAARAYKEIIGGADGGNTKFISIGKSATDAAEKSGIKIYKTAKEPSAESIIGCIPEDVK